MAAVMMTAGMDAQSGVHLASEPEPRPRWPCRIVASGSLRETFALGWQRSATIRRQCEQLAAARAVVTLDWARLDARARAKTGMARHQGVVVATIMLPSVGDTIMLLAHELQHVIEQTQGLDLKTEARRPGSGVWESVAGHYETQAAIDVSRQVAQELREKVAARDPPYNSPS
jgi:non-ribosomal peptide synthetase component F